jgi:hypothetical protein
VNTYTPGRQDGHRIAALPGGSFVVVWQSEGQDGDGFGIFGRRFAQDGRPGQEFLVNSITAFNQRTPDIAAAPDGTFLVVWLDTTRHVRGQRFDNAALRVAGEFEVDGEDLNQHAPFDPRLAASPTGDFVAAWTAETDGYVVRGRVLSADGTPKGTPFAVSEGLEFTDFVTGLTVRTDGSFVATWGQQFDGPELIRGRLFDALGGPITQPFDIGSDTRTSPFPPTGVCSESRGRFLVAWLDGNRDAVMYRRYDEAAQPITPGLMLAPREGRVDQRVPSLSCAEDGDSVAVFGEFCRERNFFGITGRRFRAESPEQAEEFRIGLPAFNGGAPVVATMAGGDFAVVWEICPTRQECDLFGQRFSLTDPAPCEGDCNGDGVVKVNELVTAVNVSLDPLSTGTVRCLSADTDLNGELSIAELVGAVGRALVGCE